MLRVLITISLMSGLPAPAAVAELTKEDIREIETVVQKSENRLREYVNLKLAAQEAKISEQFAKVDNQFTELDKRLQILLGVVIALIALIVVAIGIPQIIIAFRERKSGDWQEDIVYLKQEIETLKRNQVAKS